MKVQENLSHSWCSQDKIRNASSQQWTKNLDWMKSKMEVILEALRHKKKVHFATLMDTVSPSCKVKTNITNIQRQSRFHGDIVKDDSGSSAVFTEQGSSASQMTAAKIMDIISRLPGCDGQAADAVSAFSQVEMEDAPKLQQIPKSECPDVWIRLPRHKRPKSWANIEDLMVPIERKLYGHPVAGLLWERQSEEVFLKHGWEKYQVGTVCLFIEYKGCSDRYTLVDQKKWREGSWNWWTRHCLVSEQTCSISHQMDRSLWQTLSTMILNIHHTSDCRQYCHVGNTAQHCRWSFSKTRILLETCRTHTQHRREPYVSSGSRTFVPVSWMCKR